MCPVPAASGFFALRAGALCLALEPLVASCGAQLDRRETSWKHEFV